MAEDYNPLLFLLLIFRFKPIENFLETTSR